MQHSSVHIGSKKRRLHQSFPGRVLPRERWFWWLVLGIVILVGVGCERKPFAQGEILYQNFCSNCHMENGQGLEGLIPPLAGSDYLQREALNTACIIRYGQEGPIIVNGRRYNQPMPGIPQLTDVEITNILNYINQAWGNTYGYVPLENVRTQLERCAAR